MKTTIHQTIALVTVAAVLTLTSCTTFVGKTRKEVVQLLPALSRYPNGKIMIHDEGKRGVIGSGFRYYDTAEEIEQDAFLMKCDAWAINYRPWLLGKMLLRATQIVFDDDVVIDEYGIWYWNE